MTLPTLGAVTAPPPTAPIYQLAPISSDTPGTYSLAGLIGAAQGAITGGIEASAEALAEAKKKSKLLALRSSVLAASIMLSIGGVGYLLRQRVFGLSFIAIGLIIIALAIATYLET